MEREIAGKFFKNVNWFNNFFHDLKTLLDKITSEIEGYDKKVYYYFKSNDVPSIPQIYYVLLGSDDFLTLNISVIFDKEYVKNPLILVEEPIIFIVLHSYKKHDTTWVVRSILQDKYLQEIKEKDSIISGVVDWGEDYPDIKFYSFSAPLDAFSDYSDELVKDMIVDKLNALQAMHDDAVDEN